VERAADADVRSILFLAVRYVFALAVLTSWPALSQDPETVKARVEGSVTDLAGQPLRKVSVRLQAGGPGFRLYTPSSPQSPVPYITQTEASGTFVFEEVEPGTYFLSVERNGYVRTGYGARGRSTAGAQIVLSAGDKMTGLVVKMAPQAILYGRVTDEDGEPVSRAQVTIHQSRFVNGRRGLFPAAAAQVQPDGTFQAGNLSAGRYWVSAMELQAAWPARPGRKGAEQAYVNTYYPSGLDASTATPIDVQTGVDVRGIEIRLQKVPVVQIKGRLVSDGITPNTAVRLTPLSQDLAVLNAAVAATVRPDGAFEFQHVAPGTYMVRSQMAWGSDGKTEGSPRFARQVVTVSNTNIEDLSVALVPGVAIAGRIATELREQQAIDPSGQDGPAPRVVLNPVQLDGVGANAQASSDGSFVFQQVAPDQYQVMVVGLKDGTYVKSIHYGGQDIPSTGLDVTSSGGGQLDVLLSLEAADLSGIVRGEKGDPLAGATVTAWDTGSTTIRTATTAADGGYSIRNLPPGEYRIVAMDQIDPGAMADQGLRARFETDAIKVSLGPSGHGVADVKVLPQDLVDGELAKLP
jgi:Carboxypeptidase regulatory-like domain